MNTTQDRQALYADVLCNIDMLSAFVARATDNPRPSGHEGWHEEERHLAEARVAAERIFRSLKKADGLMLSEILGK